MPKNNDDTPSEREADGEGGIRGQPETVNKQTLVPTLSPSSSASSTPSRMPTASSPICSAASNWLVPTLEHLIEAAVIVHADTGEIVYQNHSARGFLHQSSSNHTEQDSLGASLNDWIFEGGEKNWTEIVVSHFLQQNDSSAPTGSGGCPMIHHNRTPKWSVTAQIPQYDEREEAKQIIIRFLPIGNLTMMTTTTTTTPAGGGKCSCGCDNQYMVAYLQHASSGLGGDDVEAHHRLQATMDASFDAMFTIDQKGTILMANQAAVALFGYDNVDDFFGQNVSMLCGAEHAEQHDGYLQHYLDTGMAKIMGTKRRVMAARQDKSEFPIELGIVELPTSHLSSQERFFSAFIRDLSEQERQQSQLLEQVQLTQGLVNASFDPMVQIDQRGIIQVVNEATVNMFGYSRDEIIGSNISILCGGEHGPQHDEYLQRYIQSGEKRIIGRKRPTTARRKDGTEFPIELGVQQVKRENGEWAFCGFIRDLTSHTKMKESLQRQGKLIQNQFFGGGSSEDSSEMGSTASGGTANGGRERPRRPHRGYRHANTAPA